MMDWVARLRGRKPIFASVAFITSHNGPIDDRELIRLYKTTGEMRYVGRLFEEYLPLIYGVCLKYFTPEPAKDAAMQVFEILVDKLKIHDVENFKSWLHVLTRNHCLMTIRSQKRKGELPLVLEEEQFMEKEGFYHHEREEDAFVLEHDLQALEACIGALPEEQRRSVHLFFLQEKSYQEIVEQTGFTFNKVKSYIQNGKRNLKICMEKKEDAGQK